MQHAGFIAGVAGYGLVVAGVCMLHVPSGLIVAGIGLVVWSYLVARGG